MHFPIALSHLFTNNLCSPAFLILNLGRNRGNAEIKKGALGEGRFIITSPLLPLPSKKDPPH